MQHVAQTSESDIKLESEINHVPKVGNSSTPSSPRSKPCSPPCTPPDTPPDRFSDSFQYLSDSSASGDEDNSEVDSFIIDTDDLSEEAKARISSKLLLPSSEDGGERTVDPETQARLQSLLKAAGINKFTAGDGKQLADPEVLRRLTSSVSCALDEAAAALTRMRSDSRQANKRALIKACTQGNVTAVRKLLKQGISVNETSEEGESLLSLACSAGYYELAQVLLAMHASVEDRGSKGDCTPLMEASSAGFVDIVRLLLAHGADVNAQSSTGNTPLMYACAGGHVQTVRVLLDSGANVEEHNENGHTPLMEAASAGHVEVAKMLLKHGAGINTHSNEFKESALTLACYKGHLDMVNFLLQAGADQEHKTDEMHTALMEASMDGHVEVARLLLDSGAQVNMPTDSFESPLTLAACGGHVELAILLIERGANIEEVNDEGYTPLMEAAREGHEDMVAVLLQRGARINAQTEETQETALTLACCGGFLEVSDYLIKNGADIELGASTPLMEAAQEGHIELVKYLLESGANVHAHTQTADTALTYACENGHTDVADLLVQAGANLEHESEGGRTPLMKACRAGHLCTVQFLVQKNADINRRTTNNDHTPLSLACAGGHLAIVQYLLDRGANMFHKLKDNSTMLIEAAKGGHTSVVQLLLDYPERCNAAVDNNLNLTAPPMTTLPTTTATATQTCSVPTACAAPETPASRSNAVVSSSSSVTCATSESQNNKMSNNTVRQIATALPKTAVRKLCRDPRLADLRGADMFPNGDATKIASTDESVKDDNQVTLSTFSILQNVKLKRQTQQLQQQLQQQEPFQAPQPGQQGVPQQSAAVVEQLQLVPSEQQPDLQQKEKPIRGYLLKKAMESKKIKTELQRVEQVIKEGGLNASDIIEISKELEATSIGTSSSTEPLFSNNLTSVNNQTITTSAAMTAPPLNPDATNLPPPPPLIPISEVLQSTAISDRPKAKPTKKEGKILRKQHPLVQQTQPLDLTQPSEQQTSPQSVPAKPANQDEQSLHSAGCPVALQQQTQARHLKQLAEINAQLQQQVIKNQKHIEMQKQHQQMLQQQQMQQHIQGQETPPLIGSGTITVATNAPNLAEIFSHQELLAQIQQMDSNFAKTFPDFAEKTIEKEMRVMQQMISCDTIQESLQRCHFLTSISEDEVSLEDVTNSTMNVEEKRLCDMHQSTTPMLLDASEPFSPEKPTVVTHNYPMPVNTLPADVDLRTDLDLRRLANLNIDQPNWSPFLEAGGSLSKQLQEHALLQPPFDASMKSPQPTQKEPTLADQTQPSDAGQSATKLKQTHSNLKQMLPAPQQQIQQLKQQQQQHQQMQMPPQLAHSTQHPSQKVKASPLQQQKQVLSQKQQEHYFKLGQKYQMQKQLAASASAAANDPLALNSQARQELHRHLNEMKAIAQSATGQQNQNSVTKCVADSTVNHSITSTQTNVATIKKKIPFDDATGALSKLAIGKKVRTVNPRVPPNAAAHSKEDGSHPTKVQSSTTNASLNQNFSMDVDSETESNHDTALTLACAGGHDELVELLLSRGADIEHRDKKGFTPLILAATAGHEKVVDLLLNHNADIEAQSERTKDTPLSLACSGGRYEVVDLLLTRAANKEHRNVSDYTPLSLAASGGYVNIIKLLLSHGAEINSRTGSKLGISPLMLAAMNGHTAAVKLLLDMGSDINAQIETNRNTALTLACFQGRHEVVALLLERKANVEHRAKTGLTPLMEAASGGYVEVGRVLLEKGADVNAPPVPSSRDTALTIASDKGHFRFVELLIERKAQVEVKNKKGNSPLWLAANGGHLPVVEILYKNHADIDSQDNRKVSCLMAAFRKGHVKTVQWMVDRVTQFPSDQEMTRYITTMSDKDMLDKCTACMKIIRIAKDEQAEKANENANILLEELECEKSREENKKKAAARRKERKRTKKLQKMFEKRKQEIGIIEEDSVGERNEEEEDAEEEYQPSSSKERKDDKGVIKRSVVEIVSRRNNIDIEEGDSGIDNNSLGSCSSKGSCSSNEVKVSSTDRQKDKKSKKPTLETPLEDDKPTTSTTRESRSTEKFSEIKSNKKKKKKDEKEVVKEEKVTSAAKSNKQSSKSTTKTKTSNEVTEKPTTSAKGESKSKVSNEDTAGKSALPSEEKKKSKKETSNEFIEDDDFEAVTSEHKKKKHNHDESTVITVSNVPSTIIKSTASASANVKTFTNGKQGEWKEVVRKCLSPTYRVRKVSVPLTAISRVIGRGGCNINAIRSTTGAHIEIEKQSKGQGERIITIKGSSEVSKQANTLITALIDDPELDITQILPKSSKSPSASTLWEKTATNTKSKTTTASTSMSTLKTVSMAQQAVTPAVSSVTPSVTKTISVPSTSAGIVSSATYTPTLRTSLNMTRPGAPKVSTATFTTLDKKSNQVIITTNVTTNSSASMPSSSSTKTTMSYTSAIMMSTGKAPPKSAVPTSSISTTTVVSQTFAAKVSETTVGAAAKEVKPEPMMKPPIAPPPPTSTSIFIRPPPTASAPPTLPATPNKQPFSMQSQQQQPPPQQNSASLMVSQPLTLSAQITQQLSHPPPPLPTTITSSSTPSTKMTEMPIAALPPPPSPMEEPSPVSTASEYSLFNDPFSKVPQSMWGRDNDDSASQKNMNFASIVTASGSPNSSVGGGSNHSTYLDVEPPVQVDASKAPGYRGNSMCSPNLQKPSVSTSRSSASTNLPSLSPSGSLAFSNTNSPLPDQLTPSITTPIARPTSVPSSMDNGMNFSPRALFQQHDKATANLFPCEQVQPNVSSSSSGVEDMMLRMKVVSRLNPRAPDFRVPVKQSPVQSISAGQLPPTHQPPPMYNQQSLTAAANYLNAQQHPPTMMPNSNMMSYPGVGKYGQQQQQQNAATADQWSLINAATQHSNFSQNDLINFAGTQTTLNNLIHAQGTDMLAGLENGTLTNNGMNISPNAANATLIATAAAVCVRNEERKQPRPIGTERYWRAGDRPMVEPEPNNWLMEQKQQQSWNQQMFRNNNSSAATSVQAASANTPPYSCTPQIPDASMLENVYPNDHFNGIVPNAAVLPALPPLLPHMNIGQVSTGPILQSFNPDVAGYPDSFKMESGWDPSRLCVSDIALPTEKSHHQQQPTQQPNWTLSWNH